MYIYLISNNETGKCYVGQTIQEPEKRWLYHKSYSIRGKSHSTYLAKAIAKYGVDNFTFEVVEEVRSENELNQREMWWIKTMNSLAPNGYNLDSGGKSGGRKSEITKQKISQAHLGKRMSIEARKRIGAAKRGRKLSTEHKEKIRQASTGRLHSSESKQRMKKIQSDAALERFKARPVGMRWIYRYVYKDGTERFAVRIRGLSTIGDNYLGTFKTLEEATSVRDSWWLSNLSSL